MLCRKISVMNWMLLKYAKNGSIISKITQILRSGTIIRSFIWRQLLLTLAPFLLMFIHFLTGKYRSAMATTKIGSHAGRVLFEVRCFPYFLCPEIILFLMRRLTEGFSFVNAKSHFQTIRWFWSNYNIYFNETWCEPSFYHKVKNHRSDFWYSTPKFSYGPPFASTPGGSKITKIFFGFLDFFCLEVSHLDFFYMTKQFLSWKIMIFAILTIFWYLKLFFKIIC